MKNKRRAQTGFTLLELIVALAISSLVAVMGAAAMSTALDFYQRNAHRSAAREDARAVERTLRHEWATRGIEVRSDGAVLEFDTLHPVTKQSSLDLTMAHVRYACEATTEEGLALTHRISVLPPAPASTQQSAKNNPVYVETRVLISRLQTCAFSFLGTAPDSQGKPQSRWLTTWDKQTPAPNLMRLAMSGVAVDLPPVVYKSRTGGR